MQDHWRKNLPVLGQQYRAYSIDLLGYGYSDKPSPGEANSLFNFETWAGQLEGAWYRVVDEKVCTAAATAWVPFP